MQAQPLGCECNLISQAKACGYKQFLTFGTARILCSVIKVVKYSSVELLSLKTCRNSPLKEVVSKPFSFPSPSLGKLNYRLKSKGLASTVNFFISFETLSSKGRAGWGCFKTLPFSKLHLGEVELQIKMQGSCKPFKFFHLY